MNKKTRMEIATRMRAIAEGHGANVQIDDYPKTRETLVECRFPEVSISFDIDDLFKGGILAHWYGAARDLSPMLLCGAVDSVNECHRRKATVYGKDQNDFAKRFERGCEMIASGEAFI